MMSFRRLLYMENVLDLGSLTVRNAMQVKAKVQVLRSGMSWQAVHTVISRFRYSRYPLVEPGSHQPLGVVHVKDLYAAYREDPGAYSLSELARPALEAVDHEPLETLLGRMQRTGNHMAIVRDSAGRWVGMVTLEDVLEEVVGTIEEEFPVEPPVTINEFLEPEHVLIGVEGEGLEAVLRRTLELIPPSDLPVDRSIILARILERGTSGLEFVEPPAGDSARSRGWSGPPLGRGCQAPLPHSCGRKERTHEDRFHFWSLPRNLRGFIRCFSLILRACSKVTSSRTGSTRPRRPPSCIT